MPTNTTHRDRIKAELQAAGMTKYGFTKLATKELPRILHEDEHVGGVVYGKVGSGVSAMLVATDKRMVFIDKRALFMTTDELTYDVVSGVQTTVTGPFVSVILHTRVAEYTLRYVNPTCAQRFITYIERKRLENGSFTNIQDKAAPRDISQTEPFGQDALNFLHANSLGVLSSVDRTGNVAGAYVYYLVGVDHMVYILTKSGTEKGRNVLLHSQVGLTVHEAGTMKTLQISGIAEVETDEKIKHTVYERIAVPRKVGDKTTMPPITKIDAGAFIVIRVRPLRMRYNDYAA